MGKNNKAARRAARAEANQGLSTSGVFDGSNGKKNPMTNSERNEAMVSIKQALPIILRDKTGTQLSTVAMIAKTPPGRFKRLVSKPPKNDDVLRKSAAAIETFQDPDKLKEWLAQNKSEFLNNPFLEDAQKAAETFRDEMQSLSDAKGKLVEISRKAKGAPKVSSEPPAAYANAANDA